MKDASSKSKSVSKLSGLQFKRLDRKKAAAELKQVLYNHMNLPLSINAAYSVDFLDRKFLFVFKDEYARGNLQQNIAAKKGIIGAILSFDAASGGYVSDKIVASRPLSPNKVVELQILNLRGQTLYSGTGNVRKSGIDFTIKGMPSEGRVRTTIVGTIRRSAVVFGESVMPNRIYKTRRNPAPELQTACLPN